MNDILKEYSQEEIETLAIKELESNGFGENTSLKIKEYKKT